MPYTVKFWKSGTTTWTYGGGTAPADLPPGQDTDFTTYLTSIAGASTYALNRLNNYGQDIRFGYSAGEVGRYFAGPTIDDYVLMDLAAAITVRMFNSNGKYVLADIRLTIMHELAHIYLPGADPGTPSDTNMNGAAYDFRGPVVAEQNAIATDAGLTDQIQTAYDAAFDSTDARYNLFTVNTSYSGDREVNVTRLGTDSADNIDHTARTETTVPGMLSDLLFGMGGDDIVKGGDGDDFLYGGSDPSQTSSGRDKLYGGAGGDMLFGGDENDFLDCGVSEELETLDGGAGDDILILRGDWCIATGGAGADQFWIMDSSDGDTYSITDSDAADSLYWHGYRLTGGTKQVIELIYDPGNPEAYADVGALDANGFRYYFDGTDLSIYAPDGSGILISNFANGDFGINVGSAITDTEVNFYWENTAPEVWELKYETSLGLSAIALNGTESDYYNLPGFASTLANDGPNAMPTTWLP